MTTEIELKLRILPGDAAKLRRHPALQTKAATRKLHSVYYDTPDLALLKTGYALRLRRSGKTWMQAIKGGGRAAAGLHAREEWETPLAQPTPDFAHLAEPALVQLFHKAALRKRLQPVFVTDFSRTTRALQFDDGTQIEFCLDRGTLNSGGRSEEISEIELELHAGSPRRLFEFALELLDLAPLWLEDRSKAERGYRLFNAAEETCSKSGTPALTRDMNAATGFSVIAWDCLGQLQANQRGMLAGLDVEYLHQMRVALRRLRSACKVFEIELSEALNAELKWLSAELGAARDWDVFMTQTLPPVAERFADLPGLAAVQKHCAQLRSAANLAAQAAVMSQRYQRLLLQFGAGLTGDVWHTPLLDTPIMQFSAAVLELHRKQVKKRGRHLARLDAAQRHRLRIAIKRLRYSVEFFSALYPAKRVRLYLAALAALQDVLGALNDDATLRRLLAQTATLPTSEAEQVALGVITGWSAGNASRSLLELHDKWLGYTETKRYWRALAQGGANPIAD